MGLILCSKKSVSSVASAIALTALFTASLVGCEGKSGGGSPDVKDESFDFDPIFRGGSSPNEAPLGVPVPPRDFKAEPIAEKGVKISWTFPKTYAATAMGWLIFRKVPITGEDLTWDFEKASSNDWETVLGTIAAKDCRKDGYCALLDVVGGPAEITYAAIAYWDVADRLSPKSAHVSTAVHSLMNTNKLVFGESLTLKPPFQIIGAIVPDADRKPSANVFSISDSAVPWYLLDASQSQATAYPWARLASPIFPGLDPKNGLDLVLPDPGFSRAVKFTKGKLEDCDIFTDDLKQFCQQLLISREILPNEYLGQQTSNYNLPRDQNPLPESRKFESRASSIQYGPSGKRYFFVTDRARILVREGEVYSCVVDPGEGGDADFGPEGHCGFSNSIGVFSPRQVCAFRADGTPATGESACSPADIAYSEADSTPPSDFSLRAPGAPLVVGPHLYIPDAGNARVLRLSNFEEKIKKCGRLLPPGSSDPNEFCKFDLVLGQFSSVVGDPDDASRMARRTCVRGGERGGKDVFVDVVDSTPFVDPAGTGGSGGAACRLDMVVDGAGPSPVVRRSRQASDFRDEQRSDMSPETGLLAETTKRTFRAPVALDRDARGRLYVLDYGFTRARSQVGDSEAVLPPRIMVWPRDPFSFQKCVPVDPAAAEPSCSVNQDGICLGTGCVDRQCAAAECNASVSLGQANLLYGFALAVGQDIDVERPDGYVPISSFKVAVAGDLAGVWAVTGRDARILHWKEASQTARPFEHNGKGADPSFPEPAYRTGVFAGLTVDENGGFVTGWDTKRNIGISWYGDIPGVTIAGDGPTDETKVINISNGMP